MDTASFTLPLDSIPPNFRLKGTDGKYYCLNDFETSRVLVIFFTCNQCPYVRGSDEVTRHTVEKYSNKTINFENHYDFRGNLLGKYRNKNIHFVAINSNNTLHSPEDSYEKMVERMQQHHFPWVYLWDETQEVARSYGALRTPHFFVFDDKRHLIYSGRAIDSPLDPSKMTINDLENALEDFFQGKEIKTPLTDPIGCAIKWTRKEKGGKPLEKIDQAEESICEEKSE